MWRKGGGSRTWVCACAAVTYLVSFEPNLPLLSGIPNFPLVEKKWVVIFFPSQFPSEIKLIHQKWGINNLIKKGQNYLFPY